MAGMFVSKLLANFYIALGHFVISLIGIFLSDYTMKGPTQQFIPQVAILIAWFAKKSEFSL